MRGYIVGLQNVSKLLKHGMEICVPSLLMENM